MPVSSASPRSIHFRGRPNPSIARAIRKGYAGSGQGSTVFNAKQFKKRQKQVWDAVADVYDQSFSTLGYPAALQMILEAKLQPGELVLDLASGTGMDAFTASPFVGDEGKIIGVDISERMIAVAHQKRQ